MKHYPLTFSFVAHWLIAALFICALFSIALKAQAKVDTDGDGLSDALEVGMTQESPNSRVGDHSKIIYGSNGTLLTSVTIHGTAVPLFGKYHKGTGLLLVDSDPLTKTDPSKPDTDGDGYWDGPDVLLKIDGVLIWRIGEDKNGNGKYEPAGQDGILGTDDDEFDPNNPTSHPTNFNPIESYSAIADRHDADGDGLTDAQEDKNLNGIYEPNGEDGIPGTDDDETDFRDADTDNDGLSDGFEVDLAPHNKLPFWFAQKRLDPRDPDTDKDGLPDGLELGAHRDSAGKPQTMAQGRKVNGEIVPPANEYLAGNDTNENTTFTYHNKTTNQNEIRHTYISDTDPLSITDPTRKDTNFDDISDGDSDINFNGKKDDGETDAAQGLITYWNIGSPGESLLQPTLDVAPRKYNNIIDPNSDKFSFAYQMASDATTFTVKISDERLFQVDKIVALPNSKINIITIKWNEVDPATVNNRNVEIWVESDRLPNGRTKAMKTEYFEFKGSSSSSSSSSKAAFSLKSSHPIELSAKPSSTPTPTPIPIVEFACKKNGFAYEQKPQGAFPVLNAMNYKLCWYCVSPIVLPEHWHEAAENKIDVAKFMTAASNAFTINTATVVNSANTEAINTSLDLYLDDFYYAGKITDPNNLAQSIGKSGDRDISKKEALERQWLLAVVYAEAGGYEADVTAVQQKILMCAMSHLTQLAYVYDTRIAKNLDPLSKYSRMGSKTMLRIKSKDDNPLYNFRLYDSIDSPFSGTVPSTKDAAPRNSKSKAWKVLMQWTLTQDEYPEDDPLYPPQWALKSKEDIRASIGRRYLKAKYDQEYLLNKDGSIKTDKNGNPIRNEDYHHVDVGWLKELLQVAIIVKMAMDGQVVTYKFSGPDIVPQRTSKYMDDNFSSKTNHQPIDDYGSEGDKTGYDMVKTYGKDNFFRLK